MVASRRDVIKVVGAGTAMLATAGRTGSALAQATAQAPTPTLRELPFHGQTPTPDYGAPSTASREVSIVNFDILEQQAKDMLAPGRVAFMGPAGDAVTYRENRRAFNDFELMPHRLQGVRQWCYRASPRSAKLTANTSSRRSEAVKGRALTSADAEDHCARCSVFSRGRPPPSPPG